MEPYFLLIWSWSVNLSFNAPDLLDQAGAAISDSFGLFEATGPHFTFSLTSTGLACLAASSWPQHECTCKNLVVLRVLALLLPIVTRADSSQRIPLNSSNRKIHKRSSLGDVNIVNPGQAVFVTHPASLSGHTCITQSFRKDAISQTNFQKILPYGGSKF